MCMEYYKERKKEERTGKGEAQAQTTSTYNATLIPNILNGLRKYNIYTSLNIYSCSQENLKFLGMHACIWTILQEMLRKARQQRRRNRKAKQHNTTRPKQLFFQEKLAPSGGTRTHDHHVHTWRHNVHVHVLGLDTGCVGRVGIPWRSLIHNPQLFYSYMWWLSGVG